MPRMDFCQNKKNVQLRHESVLSPIDSIKMNVLPRAVVLSLMLLQLCFSSCLDEISLNVDQGETILVIDAFVINGFGPHIVEIKQSASFVSGSEGVEEPQSGAIVSISEIGGQSYILPETDPGIYSATNMEGKAGKEYQLTVEVNGEVYQSKVEKMPEVVSISELGFELKERVAPNASGNLQDQRVVIAQVDADFSNASDPVFLRYRVTGTYRYDEITAPSNLNPNTCYIDEIIDADNIIAVDGRNVQGGILNDQPIVDKVIDWRFRLQYCFSVEQHSITEQVYNFWNTVQDEYNRTGDIFETPPAILRGNVFNIEVTKSDVIGLFSARAVDQASILLTDMDIGTSGAPRHCGGFRNNPETCFDCLLFRNSTYTKPECFF